MFGVRHSALLTAGVPKAVREDVESKSGGLGGLRAVRNRLSGKRRPYFSDCLRPVYRPQVACAGRRTAALVGGCTHVAITGTHVRETGVSSAISEARTGGNRSSIARECPQDPTTPG